MKNNMVNDNWAERNNKIVIHYFNENLPDFEITNTTSQGPYWGVEFALNDVVVCVGGDIGFNIELKIGGTMYDLWQYDKGVNNAMKTSDENVLYQLNILKKFIA